MSILDDNILEETDVLEGLPSPNDAIRFQEDIRSEFGLAKKNKFFWDWFTKSKEPSEPIYLKEGTYEYKNKYLFKEFPDKYLRVTWNNSRVNPDNWNISIRIANYSKHEFEHESDRDYLEAILGARPLASTHFELKDLKKEFHNEIEAQKVAYDLFLKICNDPSYLDELNLDWRDTISDKHINSHAEGSYSWCTGQNSHAEGVYNPISSYDVFHI